MTDQMPDSGAPHTERHPEFTRFLNRALQDPETKAAYEAAEARNHAMNIAQQNKDGQWVPVEPIGPQGIVAKVEFWLRDHGFVRLANRFGAWDERGLGR